MAVDHIEQIRRIEHDLKDMIHEAQVLLLRIRHAADAACILLMEMQRARDEEGGQAGIQSQAS